MLLSLFTSIENSAMGTAIRDSIWLFPVIESFHLIALALLGGAVLIVDMRMLGLVLNRQPVAQLAADARPYVTWGVVVMIVSGVPLFASEATKCYYSFAFWVKMISLALAILLTYTFKARVTRTPAADSGSGRLVAAMSIALWAAVGWGGRWIGFS